MAELIIQHTYETIELAIYIDNHQISSSQIPKHEASSKILLTIEELLKQNNLLLNNIKKIIVNQGPGPFTTLRTVISTVNGLAFATGIPLLGVDGLKSLIDFDLKKYPNPKIALLNAFANDVYYAFKTESEFKSGVAPITEIITLLTNLDKKFFITGNGFEMHKEKFHNLEYEVMTPNYPTIHALYSASRDYTESSRVLPLYLKQINYF